MRYLNTVVTLLALLCGITAGQTPVFVEQNGLVVVEVESVPPGDGWIKETAVSGYTGSGYYTYTVGSPTTLQPAGSGVMAYQIKIITAGTYHFRWYNYHNWPADQTLTNDSWLKVDDGVWDKCFQTSGANSYWNWKTQIEAGHEYWPTPSYNLSAGYHTVYISGRSYKHSIDRFHLSLGTANEDKTEPESPREGEEPPVVTTVEMPAIGFPYTGTNFYKDGSWLAIDPAEYTTAEVSMNFPGATGTYDITFHGVGESDGRSEYWLYVAGKLVGSYMAPISPDNFNEGDEYNKIWTGISVPEDAVVKVRAAVGSADGQEYSRGRWLKVVFAGEGGSTGTGDPVKITSPSAGTVLGMGATVTLTGTGDDLSWSYDANSDGLGPIAIGIGNKVQFTVPSNVKSPLEILITVTGSGGTDQINYKLGAATGMAGMLPAVSAADVIMVIYDNAGREVKRTGAGRQSWKTGLMPGVYYCLMDGRIHAVVLTR